MKSPTHEEVDSAVAEFLEKGGKIEEQLKPQKTGVLNGDAGVMMLMHKEN
jgi:hypothetical protein